MFPAEGADRINDPIHLPEGHTVHLLVQIGKGCLDRSIVQPVTFAVSVIQHIKDRVAVAVTVVWRMIRHILSQLGYQFFITSPSLKSVCDVTSGGGKIQEANMPGILSGLLVVLII